MLHYFKKFDDGKFAGKWIEVVVKVDEVTNIGNVIDAIVHDTEPDYSAYGECVYDAIEDAYKNR
jgi:flagellar biosynthesis GTPase FlhF